MSDHAFRRVAQGNLLRFLTIILAVLFVGILAVTAWEYYSYREELWELRRLCDSREISGDTYHIKFAERCFINHATLLSGMRPYLSFVAARNLAVYLSFVIILFGCTFILAVPEGSPIKVSASGPEETAGTPNSRLTASLETASPGLALVFMGALLVVATLYRQGSPEFEAYAPTMEDMTPSSTGSPDTPAGIPSASGAQ